MRVFQYVFDVLAWIVAIVLAIWLRYEFAFQAMNWVHSPRHLGCRSARATRCRAHPESLPRRYQVGNFDEVLGLIGSVRYRAAPSCGTISAFTSPALPGGVSDRFNNSRCAASATTLADRA